MIQKQLQLMLSEESFCETLRYAKKEKLVQDIDATATIIELFFREGKEELAGMKLQRLFDHLSIVKQVQIHRILWPITKQIKLFCNLLDSCRSLQQQEKSKKKDNPIEELKKIAKPDLEKILKQINLPDATDVDLKVEIEGVLINLQKEVEIEVMKIFLKILDHEELLDKADDLVEMLDATEALVCFLFLFFLFFFLVCHLHFLFSFLFKECNKA